MSRFDNHVFCAVAMMAVSACSGADQKISEPLKSQAQPLAATSGAVPMPTATAPAVPTAAPAPVLMHASAVPTVTYSEAPKPSTAQLNLGDPSELTTLRGIALRAATRAGVSSPKTTHAVAASDHQAAEMLLSGTIVYDHAPVYVIKMTGGPFTASSSPGRPAPRGEFLTVTVDAATHRITDVGFVNAEPDLSRIGSFIADVSAE